MYRLALFSALCHLPVAGRISGVSGELLRALRQDSTCFCGLKGNKRKGYSARRLEFCCFEWHTQVQFEKVEDLQPAKKIFGCTQHIEKAKKHVSVWLQSIKV